MEKSRDHKIKTNKNLKSLIDILLSLLITKQIKYKKADEKNLIIIYKV